MDEIEISIDGKPLKVEKGKILYEALIESKTPIRSSCGGFGKCGECIVKIIDGKEHLPPLSLEENQLLGNVFFITKERLSCRFKVEGELKIEIPPKD